MADIDIARPAASGDASHAGQLLQRVAAQAAPWLVPLAVLIAWELAARTGGLSARVLPEPLAVVKAAWSLCSPARCGRTSRSARGAR